MVYPLGGGGRKSPPLRFILRRKAKFEMEKTEKNVGFISDKQNRN